MKNNYIRFCLFLAINFVFASATFAGAANVRFGAYTAGKGCSGTGICETSSGEGALVTFDYTEQTDSSGGIVSVLTMVFNLKQAQTFGFKGDATGGIYTFTNGYTFNHPGDRNTGVPATYTIPDDYDGVFTKEDQDGNTTLTVTQTKRSK